MPRHDLSLSVVVVVAALAGTTPAMAGCNSGNAGSTNKLDTVECQAYALGNNATAVGANAYARGTLATSLGVNAGTLSVVEGATALGANAGRSGAAGFYSTAVGAGVVDALGPYSIAIGGEQVTSNGLDAIAVGRQSRANTDYGVALGYKSFTGYAATSLGTDSRAPGDSSVALGRFSRASARLSAALTSFALASGGQSVAAGYGSQATAGWAVAIGAGARATQMSSVALGRNSLANAANTVSVGTASLRRRIVNVAPGTQPNDAVTLAQVQALIARADKSKSASLTPSAQDRIDELDALVKAQAAMLAQLQTALGAQQQEIAALKTRNALALAAQ